MHTSLQVCTAGRHSPAEFWARLRLSFAPRLQAQALVLSLLWEFREAPRGPGCLRSLGTAGMRNMTSDPRSSPFSEERRVSHSLILDISLQSHPLGADSEKWLRNLKVGSQGKGPRESWPPDFQDLRTTRIIRPLIYAVLCSECLAQSNPLNPHNSPGKSVLFLSLFYR